MAENVHLNKQCNCHISQQKYNWFTGWYVQSKDKIDGWIFAHSLSSCRSWSAEYTNFPILQSQSHIYFDSVWIKNGLIWSRNNFTPFNSFLEIFEWIIQLNRTVKKNMSLELGLVILIYIEIVASCPAA